MSFEEEWAAARTGGRGDQDLNTDAAKKSKAANAIETDFEPNTRKAGDRADETTAMAVSEFTGWATGSGLKKAQEGWEKQVQGLMRRLSGEKTALRGTSNLFVNNDIATGAGFSGLNKL
ncbi:hypothetical protein GCM10020367_47870 [Streptomyces sannanensis]|uniref:WXG100 family type VII secretion target n=1 Tax=Streptomyces sannanensis TaxID=285536 RepID=A0ABP6SHX8_9ACTN